jgi:ATP-dependent protease ClpP protease subunit
MEAGSAAQIRTINAGSGDSQITTIDSRGGAVIIGLKTLETIQPQIRRKISVQSTGFAA